MIDKLLAGVAVVVVFILLLLYAPMLLIFVGLLIVAYIIGDVTLTIWEIKRK